MRNLTAKQKKLLDIWFDEQIKRGKEFGYFWDLEKDDDFSYELFNLIDTFNPCEIINQNINNYIKEKLGGEY